MNIPWSSASTNENVTIGLIVNIITPVEARLNILGKEFLKKTPSFETHEQAIMNISKHVVSVAKNP
jgi:hypothetical protein